MARRIVPVSILIALLVPLACGVKNKIPPTSRAQTLAANFFEPFKLTQRNPDATDIPAGALTKGIEIRLGASTITGSLNPCEVELWLEIELRPVSEPFRFTPTHSSPMIKRNQAAANVEVPFPNTNENLLRFATAYKWIARQRTRHYWANTYQNGCSGPMHLRCEDPRDRYSDWIYPASVGGVAFRTPFHQGKNNPHETEIETGQLVGGTVASLRADDAQYFEVGSVGTLQKRATWIGLFRDLNTTMTDLTVVYKGQNSNSCNQNIDILRWSDNTWINLDRRDVGNTDVEVTVVASQPNSQFLNNEADMKVRVWCQSLNSFVSRGNEMSITYRTQ